MTDFNRFVHRSLLLLASVLLLTFSSGCDSGGGGDAPPPPSPVQLSAEQVEAGISLTWVSNASGDIDGFNVYRASGSGATADGSPINGSGPVSEVEYLDDTVADGELYSYVVTTVEGDRESESSTSVEIRYFPDSPTRP